MDSTNHEVEMEEDDMALPPTLHPEPIHPQVEEMEHADCAGGGGDVGQEPGKMERNKRNYQRYPKPPYSYVALICLAITRSMEMQLTLRQIFSLISSMFPFFTGEYKGWRDSVRHNLSANKCFSKVLKDPSRPGCKGNHWTLDIDKVPPEALLRQNTAESRKARSPYPQDLRPYLLDPGLRLWTCSPGQDEASARNAAAAASAPGAEVSQPLPRLAWTNSDAPVPLYRPPPALASALERFHPSPSPPLPPFSSICDVSAAAAASSSSTPFLSVAGHFLAPLAGVPTYQPLVSALPPPPPPDVVAWGDAAVLPSCPSLPAMSPHPASSAPSSSSSTCGHVPTAAGATYLHQQLPTEFYSHQQQLPLVSSTTTAAAAASSVHRPLRADESDSSPAVSRSSSSASSSSSSSVASSPFSRSPSPAPGGPPPPPPPPGPVDVSMALASPAGQRRRRHRHQAGERQCQRRRRHERRDTGGDRQRPLGLPIPSSSASSSSSSSSSASSADAAADAEGRRSWHAAWVAQPWQGQPGNGNVAAALGNNYNMAAAHGYAHGNMAAAHGYAHGNVAAAHGYGNVAAAHGYGNMAAAHGYGNVAAAHGYGNVAAAHGYGNVAAAHGYGNVAAAHGYGNVAAAHGYGNVVAAHGYAHGNVATAVAYGNPAPQALVPWELPASHSKFTPPNAVAPPAGPDSLAFLGGGGGGGDATLPAYRSPPSLSCSPSPSPSSTVSSSSLSSSLNPSSPPLQLVSYWVRSRDAGLLYQVPTFLDYERVYGIMPPNKSVFDLFLVPASPAAAIQPGVPFPSSSSSSSSSSFPQGR